MYLGEFRTGRFYFQILRDMEVSIIQLNEAVTSSKTPNSSDPEATLLVLKDLLPGIEEFNIKALPMMEDLRKLKRQAADQVRHWLSPLLLCIFYLNKERIVVKSYSS